MSPTWHKLYIYLGLNIRFSKSTIPLPSGCFLSENPNKRKYWATAMSKFHFGVQGWASEGKTETTQLFWIAFCLWNIRRATCGSQTSRTQEHTLEMIMIIQVLDRTGVSSQSPPSHNNGMIQDDQPRTICLWCVMINIPAGSCRKLTYIIWSNYLSEALAEAPRNAWTRQQQHPLSTLPVLVKCRALQYLDVTGMIVLIPHIIGMALKRYPPAN